MHILHKQHCSVGCEDLTPITNLTGQRLQRSQLPIELTADLLQIDAPSDVIVATNESLYATALVCEFARAAGLTRCARSTLLRAVIPSGRQQISRRCRQSAAPIR